jgi:hypothetical protein
MSAERGLSSREPLGHDPAGAPRDEHNMLTNYRINDAAVDVHKSHGLE